MPEITPKTRSIAILLLLVLHLAITLPLAWQLNIWVDEASTLYATQHGFWNAFQTAAIEQKQAPLYFWFISLWRYLSESIFFARLFSIICSLVAIKLFAGLAQRYFSRVAALLITAFFALHPYLIWASVEIRVYSLVILLSVILLCLFFDAFWDEDVPEVYSRPKFAKALFLAAVILSLYTNYYLGFLIAGLGAALVMSGKWREFRIYAVMMLVAALAFVPMVIDLRAEFIAKTGDFQEERSLVEGVQIIWRHVLTFVLPTEIFPATEQSVFSFLRLWLMRFVFAVIATLAVINRRKITKYTRSLGCIAATVCLFLFAANLLVGSSYIAVRHASVLFVPLILFIASVVKDIFADTSWHRRRIAVVGVSMIIFVSFCYSTIELFPNMTKRGDWASVGEFISQHESANQPIIVFITYEALALRYHYRGVNRILPDEKFFEYSLDAKAGSRESHRREIDFVISEIPDTSEQIWLAVGEKCSISEACVPLQNYIEANYTIEIEKDFYLEKLYLLRRKQQ